MVDDEGLDDGRNEEGLTLTVGEESAGMRLDSYLAEQITTTSRTQIRRAIEAGKVRIDGITALKPASDVAAGATIEVELLPPAPLEAKPSAIELDILHEDEAIIVINKPAGMVTHPGAGVNEGTLANALVHHFAVENRQLPRRGGPSRPGIVHRLDAGTSGVIVVARTDAAHLSLAEQFQSRTVSKSYIALSHGMMPRDEGRIEAPIGRDPRHRVKMAVRPAGEGRDALTLWRVMRRFDGFTLLDVAIMTGRTHQIRVHLAHISHPIAADPVYGGGRANSVRDAVVRAALSRLDRPFLHAARLGLRHPLSGEWLEFSAPLPQDLQRFLDLIEARTTATGGR